MLDLPPPTTLEAIEKPLTEAVITAPSQSFTEAQEASFKLFAENLRSVFDDGFQFDDLFEIVRRSFSYMNQYETFSPNQKRDGVVYILNHFIDITDTPGLPDEFTDPIMKSLLPAYVDFVHWAMNYKRPIEMEDGDEKAIQEFLGGLTRFAADNIDWQLVFEGMKESFIYFSKQIPFTNQQKKDGIYLAACIILDITVWPFALDPILDPLTKALLRPAINYTIDAIFPEE